MDENLELLEYIYQTSEMGTKSMTSLLKDIQKKDNKLKGLISEQLKGYEKYLKESKEIIKKHKTSAKSTGTISQLMAKMSIKKEVMIDNSDTAIAEMLIQGFTMGSIELEKRIDNFEGKADKKIIALAKELLKFGKTNIKKLKSYL